MGSHQEIKSLEYARRTSPECVDDAHIVKPENLARMGFYGDLGPSAVNRVFSLIGTLEKDFSIYCRIQRFYSGCFEVDFSLKTDEAVRRLFQIALDGGLDGVAFSYRIIFIRVEIFGSIEEVHYRRDSLYRERLREISDGSLHS